MLTQFELIAEYVTQFEIKAYHVLMNAIETV